MSHEIRTPMNGIIGMTDLLLDGGLADEERRKAETIKLSAEALLTIINDILDYSKIEAGHLDLESTPFRLRDLIEGSIDIVAPRLKSGDVDILYRMQPGADGTFLGDPVRVRQILLNLLGNAVKFTEFGSVLVEAGVQDGQLEIRVCDTGIGVPDEVRARLFRKFVQADSSTSRRFGGTGLGLAISRQLAELMGGEIGFSSEDGKGSVFWFRLPLAVVEPDRMDLGATLAGLRVLVVDDSVKAVHVLAEQVMALGGEAETTPSAFGAMECLRSGVQTGRPFNAIVADQSLPAVSGADLMAMVAADSQFSIPIRVLAVASYDPQTRGAGKNVQGVAILEKPFHLRQLIRVLTDAPKDAAPAGAREPSSSSMGALRILLVEDNEVNQQVAVGLLNKLGHVVDVASDAGDGVAMARRGGYDLVFMDVQLPDMDGYEATGLIRSFPDPTGRVPVVAMTANAMEGDRERCLAAGMDDFLPKPVRRVELAAMLERWGRRRP